MRYLALVLMTTFLGPSLARAGDLSGLGNQLLDMQVRAMTPWRQNDGDMQVVVANAPNDKGRDTVPRLLFFGRAPNGMALQYSEEGEIAPVAVFQTNSVGGPLLVIWGSGTGLIVRAYALVNGKIQRVLDDGSFRMPEVIHPNISDDSTVDIVLAEPGWVEVNGTKEKRATAARRYRWNGSQFAKVGTSDWAKRIAR